MSKSGKFRVSLHVSHPTLSADDITGSFSLRPKYVRSVGCARTTKQGKDLGGVYSQTDVSFDVGDGLVDNDEVLLAEFIDQSVESLPLKTINSIVVSGGTCFFFIGIYSENNLLCDFGAGLLLRLANHGIGLKLDFYGGPE
jgi:hypothetical protein